MIQYEDGTAACNNFSSFRVEVLGGTRPDFFVVLLRRWDLFSLSVVFRPSEFHAGMRVCTIFSY